MQHMTIAYSPSPHSLSRFDDDPFQMREEKTNLTKLVFRRITTKNLSLKWSEREVQIGISMNSIHTSRFNLISC